jgi:hypothetical protein
MRALILVAAVLSLAACKNNDQVDNTQNVDESLTAENIVSNDVTAIDAVTGDAANMAAESPVNDLGNVSNDTGNTAAFPRPKPQTVSASSTKSPPPTSTAPSTNSVSNAATNGE